MVNATENPRIISCSQAEACTNFTPAAGKDYRAKRTEIARITFIGLAIALGGISIFSHELGRALCPYVIGGVASILIPATLQDWMNL